MPEPTDLLETQIDHLHSHGRLRVWSLVITVFGDAVQLRGGQVAMADLQSLTERLRIEVGTLRTAMSRLAKDGWLARRKRARNSYYRLAETGTAAFASATRRIYAGKPDNDDAVTLGLLPTSGRGSMQRRFLSRSGACVLRAGVAIWNRRDRPADADLAATGVLAFDGTYTTAPEWARALFGAPEQAKRFETLSDRWEQAADNLSMLHRLSPLDAMALRTLLIHDWRRTLLRTPDLPAALLPQDWPEAKCRARVGTIYHALLPASEQWWETPITPDGMDALDHRFPTQGRVTMRNFINF